MGCCRSKPQNPRTESNAKADRIAVALHDYTKSDQECQNTVLSFSKGDRMYVIKEKYVDWWYVKLLTSEGGKGFVPSNHVAYQESLISKDWYFEDLSRVDTEKLLMEVKNIRGTYLVRPSTHGYTLSIKDWEPGRKFIVKHYKIHSDHRGYYIAENKMFQSLQMLILAYSREQGNLCNKLVQPCPKQIPTIVDHAPEVSRNWEISRKHIELLDKIGAGNFGDVRRGLWKKKYVAVKTMREKTMSRQEFLAEATIMKTLRHKNIVALYGICSEDEPIFIVQELMSEGSLLDYLRREEIKQTLRFEDLIYIASEISSGMTYLEELNLVHRDLAARNVLIGENHTAKICDFGLANATQKIYTQMSEKIFPVKWTAIEALLYSRFSVKSDVWSFGILLMELFTFGMVPYVGLSNVEVIDQLKKGIRMKKPDDVRQDIYDEAFKCWDAHPVRRPTFAYLKDYFLNHSVWGPSQYTYDEYVNQK